MTSKKDNDKDKKIKGSGDALEDDFALSDIEEDNVAAISDSEEEELPKRKQKKQVVEKAPVKTKKSKTEREENVLELSKIELADHFWSKLRKFYPEKSTIELEVFKLEEESFIENEVYTEPHTINNFGDFIKKCSKDATALTKSIDKKGSPIVLVITPSAIRATSVVRAIREVSDKLPVGKLFAKHMKIPEQKSFLESVSFTLGVGTPNRISKLIELGYLDLSRLELVVIDLFKDAKNRNLFNINECGKDWFELHQSYLNTVFKEKDVKLAYF